MAKYKFKLALIGDFGCGKSSLYRRIVSGDWVDSSNSAGAEETDFAELDVKVGDSICRISLWDTAGMEEHSSIEGSYFRGLHGFFLVYSIGSWSSFERIEYWRDQIEMFAVDGVELLLIGNKCDLAKKARVVEEYEGKKLSAKLKIPFLETSAKSNTNVKAAVQELCKRVIESKISGILVSQGVQKAKGTIELTDENAGRATPDTTSCCK
eukprot:gb/GEZN01018990.1/.p1 GENE.gb/GEZN01018990.1/~~gb/GEZN01018990.1/.p1  ORF type:complete len:210 (-),score=12.07 gb/GEZN01018990.1/:85-714(-)